MHVAIVSLGYPPIPHVSGTRPAGMAGELVRLGHDVTVFTVDWRVPGAAAEDGRVNVVRVDPRAWFPEFVPRPPVHLERHEPRAVVRRARTLARTLRWGPFAPWARAALARAMDLHARAPIDVVWGIHGDDSAHEVAYRFARRARVPWVADFKDAWDLFHPGAAWPVQWLATRRRLASAAALTETATTQAELDARFGRPVHFVPTGYDPAAMREATPARVSAGFSLLYVGHVSSHQHDPARVGRAIAQWSQSHPEMPIELHVFGHDAAPLEGALRAHGAGQALRVHPFVDRARAYGLMKGADALLLLPSTLAQTKGGFVGVKELEYFASGSPVLVLGDLTPEMTPFARGLASVRVARTPEEAVAALLPLARAHREGAPSPARVAVNHPALEPWTWPGVARTLEAVLRDAARATNSRYSPRSP